MNALTVISFVALAACSSGQFFTYPGIYGYPGFLPATAAPVTLKTVPSSPIALNTIAHTPLAYNVAPVAPVHSQYHAQDEFGQYSFGYAGGPSSRVENRDAFGVVRGSYNYVDPDGKIHTQHYVADALGFRVAGTDLPVAPDAPAAAAPLALPGPLPVAVRDTPEVAAAKIAHKAAYEEAAAAAAAAAVPERKKRSLGYGPALPPLSPLRFSYGFSAPLTYSHQAVVRNPLQYTATVGPLPAFAHYAHAAPAFTTYAAGGPAVTAYTAGAATTRNAELLRVVHNPGHAVSYRVD